nr:hypothetical protein Iba_chr15dCG8030 [Ipomoea batatas]
MLKAVRFARMSALFIEPSVMKILPKNIVKKAVLVIFAMLSWGDHIGDVRSPVSLVAMANSANADYRGNCYIKAYNWHCSRETVVAHQGKEKRTAVELPRVTPPPITTAASRLREKHRCSLPCFDSRCPMSPRRTEDCCYARVERETKSPLSSSAIAAADRARNHRHCYSASSYGMPKWSCCLPPLSSTGVASDAPSTIGKERREMLGRQEVERGFQKGKEHLYIAT